jgi:hypothetical protein
LILKRPIESNVYCIASKLLIGKKVLFGLSDFSKITLVQELNAGGVETFCREFFCQRHGARGDFFKNIFIIRSTIFIQK